MAQVLLIAAVKDTVGPQRKNAAVLLSTLARNENNKEIVRSLEWFQDTLKDNGLKFEETTYRLGRWLELDPETEKFVNDPEANALLTRPYRKPFVVPERV